MTFPCNACGACCRKLSQGLANMEQAGLRPRFPHAVLPDGSCSQLLPDNSCAVYADRPLVCRVDDMIDLLQLDRAEAYELTKQECNLLKTNEGRVDFL